MKGGFMTKHPNLSGPNRNPLAGKRGSGNPLAGRKENTNPLDKSKRKRR